MLLAGLSSQLLEEVELVQLHIDEVPFGLVHTCHQRGLGHVGVDDLYDQPLWPHHLVLVVSAPVVLLLPLRLAMPVLLIAPFNVGHDAPDGIVDAALSGTRARHQAVHQRRLVLHVVGVGKAHAAQMRSQRREDGVGHSRLVDIGRFRGQQLNQLGQLSRHFWWHRTPLVIREAALARRASFGPARGEASPALDEQLLLILQQPLTGIGVVLVEVTDQLLDVLVAPVFGHQFRQHPVHLLLRQQLSSPAQHHLHACMPASFVQEVALHQSLLLHHAASDKAHALVDVRSPGCGGLRLIFGLRSLPGLFLLPPYDVCLFPGTGRRCTRAERGEGIPELIAVPAHQLFRISGCALIFRKRWGNAAEKKVKGLLFRCHFCTPCPEITIHHQTALRTIRTDQTIGGQTPGLTVHILRS